MLLGSVKTSGHATIKAASPVAIAADDAAIYYLTDFGAAGDGVADDGPALQRALDALAEAGGGSLIVAAGRYAIRTPVSKDFTGLADAVAVLGIESSTPVDTSQTPDVSTRGLQLTSEFYPMAGSEQVALRVSGLQNFMIRDIAFVGTPNVFNDAMITLDLERVEQATVMHCEFYGLRSDTAGGAIISARRSRLRVEQTMFLGTFGYSALYVPVIQNLEWKDINITTTIFADYGQRPGFHGKTQGATLSWVTIGNPAAADINSPRREVVIRDVIMDEGAYFGIFCQPARYQSPSPPIDLLYITDLFQNVSNLGAPGNLIYDVRNVLIENSHYGFSHHNDAAISLNNVGTAIIEGVECVDSADRIRADAATGKLYVINSIYSEVVSEAHFTKLMQDVAEEDDPVRYVRQRFQTTLGRDPQPSEHFYWADRILACGDNAQCVADTRKALAAHLAAAPPVTFALAGKVLDEDGMALPDVTVTLSGAAAIVTRTKGEGIYQFSNLPTSGNYMVVPSKNHYLMGPSARTVLTSIGDRMENFTATLRRYAIRGRVVNKNNYGFQGVTVTLSGAQNASVLTDTGGYFSFTGLKALGSYTVTPSVSYHSFTQESLTFASLTADQSVNFIAERHVQTIGGRVTNGGNSSLAGVLLTLNGLQTGTTRSDINGNYTFANLPVGGDYTVTPTRPRFAFAPTSRTVTMSGTEITGLDFAGNSTASNPQPANGSVIISEFRLAGTTSDDEFIELYNNTDAAIDISGYQLDTLAGPVITISATASLPARAHYLIASATGYTLTGHAADIVYEGFDLPVDTGLALFNASGVILDAVGLGTTPPPYREGSALPVVGEAGQYSFVRRFSVGLPQDTGNNALDFILVASSPSEFTNTQATLGAPGPENLKSPVLRNAVIKASLIDPTTSSAASPNRNRSAAGANPTNAAYGTLDIRRKFTNKTGARVTALRFRIVDITTRVGTSAPPVGTADLRLLSSVDTMTNDEGIFIVGTTLDAPVQTSGGGYNSSVTVDLPGGMLANGASVNVRFLLGVQQEGSFRFLINVEALPGPVIAFVESQSSKRTSGIKSSGSRKQ
jgi:hypothetical protein